MISSSHDETLLSTEPVIHAASWLKHTTSSDADVLFPSPTTHFTDTTLPLSSSLSSNAIIQEALTHSLREQVWTACRCYWKDVLMPPSTTPTAFSSSIPPTLLSPASSPASSMQEMPLNPLTHAIDCPVHDASFEALFRIHEGWFTPVESATSAVHSPWNASDETNEKEGMGQEGEVPSWAAPSNALETLVCPTAESERHLVPPVPPPSPPVEDTNVPDRALSREKKQKEDRPWEEKPQDKNPKKEKRKVGEKKPLSMVAHRHIQDTVKSSKRAPAAVFGSAKRRTGYRMEGGGGFLMHWDSQSRSSSSHSRESEPRTRRQEGSAWQSKRRTPREGGKNAVPQDGKMNNGKREKGRQHDTTTTQEEERAAESTGDTAWRQEHPTLVHPPHAMTSESPPPSSLVPMSVEAAHHTTQKREKRRASSYSHPRHRHAPITPGPGAYHAEESFAALHPHRAISLGRHPSRPRERMQKKTKKEEEEEKEDLTHPFSSRIVPSSPFSTTTSPHGHDPRRATSAPLSCPTATKEGRGLWVAVSTTTPGPGAYAAGYPSMDSRMGRVQGPFFAKSGSPRLLPFESVKVMPSTIPKTKKNLTAMGTTTTGTDGLPTAAHPSHSPLHGGVEKKVVVRGSDVPGPGEYDTVSAEEEEEEEKGRGGGATSSSLSSFASFAAVVQSSHDRRRHRPPVLSGRVHSFGKRTLSSSERRQQKGGIEEGSSPGPGAYAMASSFDALTEGKRRGKGGGGGGGGGFGTADRGLMPSPSHMDALAERAREEGGPGPGAYAVEQTMLGHTGGVRKESSLSYPTFGAASRFPVVGGTHGTTHTPGPGSYAFPSPWTGAAPDLPRVPCRVLLRPPSTLSSPSPRQWASPGPGHYTPSPSALSAVGVGRSFGTARRAVAEPTSPLPCGTQSVKEEEATTPGPGAYDTGRSSSLLGGRGWVDATGGTFPRAPRLAAAEGGGGEEGDTTSTTPGPGAYDPYGTSPWQAPARSSSSRTEGGGEGGGLLPAAISTTWGTSPRFDRLAQREAEASRTPGPGAYTAASLAAVGPLVLSGGKGGTFGEAPRWPSSASVGEEEGSRTPGPGAYAMPSLSTGPALRFSFSGRTTTAVDGEQGGGGGGGTQRSSFSSSPGPGSYSPSDPSPQGKRTTSLATSSPRFSTDTFGSGGEKKEGGPGPGEYDTAMGEEGGGGVGWTIPHASRGSGVDGHLPFPTTSASSSHWMVPGPGTYSPNTQLVQPKTTRALTLGTAPRLGSEKTPEAGGSTVPSTAVGPGSYDLLVTRYGEATTTSPSTAAAMGWTMPKADRGIGNEKGEHGRGGGDTTTTTPGPGPGHYTLPSFSAIGGGGGVTMGMAPRWPTTTDVGGPQRNAADENSPGPGAYTLPPVLSNGRLVWPAGPRREMDGGGVCGVPPPSAAFASQTERFPNTEWTDHERGGGGGGPGPGAYEVLPSWRSSTGAAASGIAFGTTPRALEAPETQHEGSAAADRHSPTPGPGAYTLASKEGAGVTIPRAPRGEGVASLGAAGQVGGGGVGPGAYDPFFPPSHLGVGIGAAPRHVGDEGHERRTATTPGPGAYDPYALGGGDGRSGSFGTAVRAAAAAGEATAEDGPGPGAYEVFPLAGLGPSPSAPSFASHAPRWAREATAEGGLGPGPAGYDPHHPSWDGPHGIRIGAAPRLGHGMSMVEEGGAAYPSSSSFSSGPGPAAYTLPPVLPSGPSYSFGGGEAEARQPLGRPPSDAMPGPGAYTLPPSFPSGPSVRIAPPPHQGEERDSAASPGPGAYLALDGYPTIAGRLKEEAAWRGGAAATGSPSSLGTAVARPPWPSEVVGGEVPGPGAYLSWDGEDGSRTLGGGPSYRFPSAARADGLSWTTAASPGPGAYDYKGDQLEWQARHGPLSRPSLGLAPRGLAADPSLSPFATPLGDGAGGEAFSTPGPGYYEMAKDFCRGSASVAAVFRSQAPRFPPSASQMAAVPGPGAYASEGAMPSSSAPSVLFGSAPRLCGGGSVVDRGPSSSSSSSASSALGFGSSSSTPGPGAYEVGLPFGHGSPSAVLTSRPGAVSLPFHAGEGGGGPGPGSYHIPSHIGYRGREDGLAVSIHGGGGGGSEWDRLLATASTTPGPGAYDPLGTAEMGGEAAYGGGVGISFPKASRPVSSEQTAESTTSSPGPGAYDPLVNRFSHAAGVGGGDLTTGLSPGVSFAPHANRLWMAPRGEEEGTPGPGAYHLPYPMGDRSEREDGGGFPRGLSPGFSFPHATSHGWGSTDGSTVTPGPGAYTIGPTMGEGRTGGGVWNGKSGMGPSFSLAAAHASEIPPSDSPGPGSYDLHGGGGGGGGGRNGHAGRLSSGVSFSLAARDGMAQDALETPGPGTYSLPPTFRADREGMGVSPGFSFPTSAGHPRNGDLQDDRPGPGSYDLQGGGGGGGGRNGHAGRLSSGVSFSLAARDGMAQDAMETPGPGTYSLPPTFRADREGMGVSPGFSFPTSAGHPRNGDLQDDRPGPGTYDLDSAFHAQNRIEGVSPGFSFPVAPGHESFLEASATPGPGSYYHDVHVGAGRTEGISPGFSFPVAPGHESFLEASATPGPGSYYHDVHVGAGRTEGISPGFSFPVAPGHESFLEASATPGPGSYYHDARVGSDGRWSALGYSFPTSAGHASAVSPSVFSIPGPGAYHAWPLYPSTSIPHVPSVDLSSTSPRFDEKMASYPRYSSSLGLSSFIPSPMHLPSADFVEEKPTEVWSLLQAAGYPLKALSTPSQEQ